MDNLLKIMKRLRSPGGCPWDREQTIKSLRPYLLEETYEVLDAMESKNPEMLCEELGDLLLQIIFQSQVSEENGDFCFQDVVDGITKKMISRHPHVFSDLILKTADDVVDAWQGFKEKEGKKHIFSGIPESMPALIFAEKLQHRARKIGLDFKSKEEVFEKIYEEIDEIKDVCNNDNNDMIEEEIGDLLFSVVNLARSLAINPELALLKSSKKFKNRVEFVEKEINRSENPAEIIGDPDLLDNIWQKTKKNKGGNC